MPEARQIFLPKQQITIEAITYGDSHKPLILALHGWLDNADSFALLAPLLEDYHIVAIDFPGHGFSVLPATPEPFSLHFYVDVIAEVVEQLTNQPLIIIGHSMGGAAASVFTAENPEKVTKLVLIDVLGPLSSDTLADHPTIETNAKKMQVAALHASSKVYPSFEEMVHIRMHANHLSYEQAVAMTQRGVVKTEQGFQWRYDPRIAKASAFYYSEPQVLDLLAKIACPVLVVAGTEGIFKGRDFYQKRLDVMPDHHLILLEGHHHIHLEKSAKVMSEIKCFLDAP